MDTREQLVQVRFGKSTQWCIGDDYVDDYEDNYDDYAEISDEYHNFYIRITFTE